MTGTEDNEGREEKFHFSDKRRIDPETFQARPAATPPAEPAQPADPIEELLEEVEAQAAGVAEADALIADAVAQAQAQATEAMNDLKRITAEYANYRKRVDRDRDVQRDLVIASVLNDLLPLLDDVERAREHDELEGGFKSVGEALEAVTAKYGLETYGEAGEEFDPTIHEAMTSEPSDEVEVPTVSTVFKVGYRLRGRVVRPALVAVLDTP